MFLFNVTFEHRSWFKQVWQLSLATTRPALLLLRQTKRYHSRRWLVELINRLTPTALPLAEVPVNHVCRKKKKWLKCTTPCPVFDSHRKRDKGRERERERGIRHRMEWCDNRSVMDDLGCVWAVMVARTRFVSVWDWFFCEWGFCRRPSTSDSFS